MFNDSKGSLFATFVLSIIFGILLVFATETFLVTINYVLVSIFLILGVVQLISFFMNKSYKHEIYNNLIVGIICIWSALFIYVYYGSLIFLLPVILSLYAFVVGAITLTKFLKNKMIPYIIISILSFIIGVLLLFKPALTVTLYLQITGVYIIITSLVYLFEFFQIKKHFK